MKENAGTASVFSLKWFTPICEVNLCGHATLATAAVIFNVFKNPNRELTFKTLGGDLKAVKVAGSKDDGTGSSDDEICLDLPLAETVTQDQEPIKELISSVIGDLPLTDCRFSNERKKLLLRLADTVTRGQLEAMRPDTSAMVTAHTGKIRGVIVTVKSTEEKYDFLSRYFAPWVGIPEDPVTGLFVYTNNCL